MVGVSVWVRMSESGIGGGVGCEGARGVSLWCMGVCRCMGVWVCAVGVLGCGGGGVGVRGVEGVGVAVAVVVVWCCGCWWRWRWWRGGGVVLRRRHETLPRCWWRWRWR